MLQRDGVQIFISTHDYFLAKYIEVKRESQDSVAFYSFYTQEPGAPVMCEKAESFSLLEHNSILATFRQLYRDEIGVTLR